MYQVLTSAILTLNYRTLVIVDFENLETTLLSSSTLEQEWAGMYGTVVSIM